jgi:hypothetical protein
MRRSPGGQLSSAKKSLRRVDQPKAGDVYCARATTRLHNFGIAGECDPVKPRKGNGMKTINVVTVLVLAISLALAVPSPSGGAQQPMQP